MSKRMQQWVKLPSRWILDGGLKSFRWARGSGADGIAALLILLAIAHRVDPESGLATLTYDELEAATGISRAKISAGLDLLERHELVDRGLDGRSTYALASYDPGQGWAKLPARPLYGASGNMLAFTDFKLRQQGELNALKLYLVLLAFRDNETSLTLLSFDKIVEYAGIDRARIKQAQSILILGGLLQVERSRSTTSDFHVANAYRVPQLDPYAHAGTRGRLTEMFLPSASEDVL